jgi:hypothetical protein
MVDMNDEYRLKLLDCKYTVVWGPQTILHVFRFGEQLRYCLGNELILAMATEIAELREKLKQYDNIESEA